MLEQKLRQRVVGRELLQHLLVGRRLAGGGLLEHRQLHALEKNLAQLSWRPEVEGAAGELEGLLLERQHPRAELLAVRREQLRIDQHAVALHAEEHLPRGQLDLLVDLQQLRVGGKARIEIAVKLQRYVGFLRRVLRRAFHGHLLEADLARAFAGHLRVGDRLEVEVTPGEAVQVVRAMRLQNVRLQQGVVRHAAERDAVVGEHVLIVLDVVPQLPCARIF